MRKNIIIGIIVVLLCGMMAYCHFTANDQEKETAIVAEKYIEAIARSWNVQEFERRADEGLVKAMSSQGQTPEQLMNIYSKLGIIEGPPVCKAKTTTSFYKAGHQHTSISYACDAQYANGTAVVSITLNRADNEEKWLIYYLHIASDLFPEVIE